MKMLSAHFSYNSKLEHEMNLQSHIIKFENIVRLLLKRNLTIKGKVFRNLNL